MKTYTSFAKSPEFLLGGDQAVKLTVEGYMPLSDWIPTVSIRITFVTPSTCTSHTLKKKMISIVILYFCDVMTWISVSSLRKIQ
jgi:hypothetical protein